jgi:hypothetical protein
MQLRAALGRLLPVFALAVIVMTTGATLAVAGDTLGYDFRAYHLAGTRLLAGQAVYDLSYQEAGPYGLFLYPPTFLPLILPFALLPVGLATWAWTAAMVACFALAVAVMPVPVRVRWWIVLFAGLSWPFVYAVKLGQVGPLLVLLFAIGWRSIERPAALGVAGALGAAVKVQPGILLAWALFTRRWAAVVAGAVTLVALAALATLLAGVSAWPDFLTLIARVSDPITTPHNFTPGAVAYQVGLARDTASMVQLASTVLVVLLVVVAALRLPGVASYMAAVIASQLLSPVLWDHYAVVLLLPVAWLLARGHVWAVLFVLVTPVFGFDLVPAAAYPAAMWGCLLAVLAVGARDMPGPAGGARTMVAGAGQGAG